MSILEVVATDTPNSCVVAVTLKQTFAIREEVRVGDAIIFKDDTLVYMSKKPTNRSANTESATLIFIRIKVINLAGPVNLIFNYLSRSRNLCRFTRTIEVGPITGNKHAGGRNRTNRVDYLPKGLRTAPSN